MKLSKNHLIITAAFAGLAGGTAARASQQAIDGSQGVLAQLEDSTAAKKKVIEKHACKGMNSCKGNGGGSKAEYGKNSCKGQGSCATDGSKKSK